MKPKGKRPPSLTIVGTTFVELRSANFPTTVVFTAGEHGRGERGLWAFWTTMLKRPVRFKDKLRRRIIGRAFAVLPPGERFTRMRSEAKTAPDPEERSHDYGMWYRVLKQGHNVKYIRPSTPREVRLWANAHEADSKHMRSLQYGGEMVWR